MKRTFISLLIATTLLISTTHAQEAKKKHPKATFGIQGGANMNNKVGKSYPNGDKLDLDYIAGFHLGINVEIPLVSSLYFQPGVQFIAKGVKDKNPYYTSTFNIYYVEMPLNFMVKPQAGNGNFLIGLGANFAYGISGKWKYDEVGGTQKDKDGKIKFKNTVDPSVIITPSTNKYEKPLDVAIGLLLGYQLKNGLLFQLNGQYGVINTTPEIKLNNPAIVQGNAKNIGFGLSVGYRF